MKVEHQEPSIIHFLVVSVPVNIPEHSFLHSSKAQNSHSPTEQMLTGVFNGHSCKHH